MADNNNKEQQQKQQKQQQFKNDYLQVPDNFQNKQQQQQHSHQQQHIQKKHSGPLDAVLNELEAQAEAEAEAEKEKSRRTTTTTPTTTTTTKKHIHTHPHTHTHTHIHGHGRKRERWLLTRKTWKFMQDAGRKLLPENVQNRREDIPLIEAHFQEICANEHKFLIWRRKVSFPGARRTSLRLRHRRLPLIRRHQQQHQQQLSADQTADHTMELLAKYLNLDDHNTNTSAMLSSKTQQPHQTVSPSAQRPTQQHHQYQQQQPANSGEKVDNSEIGQLLAQLRALSSQLSESLNENWLPKPESITRDLLENKTFMRQIYNALKRQQLHRQLSRHNTITPPTLLLRRTHSFNHLTTTIPASGCSAPKVEQRKQQPPADLKLKSTTANLTTTTPATAATTTKIPLNRNSSNQSHVTGKSEEDGTFKRQLKSTRTTTTATASTNTPRATTASTLSKQEQKQRRIKLNTCGTQTNFIPLQEIKQLANEYREQRQQQQQQSNDELETGTSGSGSASGLGAGRKSSIENADISPTVSDTIKRYLRMARKKSVVDKQQQQQKEFRRINYDRQLRQIRARGEINPPGMDEDNHKAIQTLEAWPLIMLDFIRNNESQYLTEAHREWQQQLDERVKRKMEYENKLQQQQQQQQMSPPPPPSSSTSTTTTTTPTSPPYDHDLFNEHENNLIHSRNNNNSNSTTSLFTTSQQFLSNLWHGNTNNNNNNNQDISNNNNNKSIKFFNKHFEGATTDNTDANMQKSKSSSHVGHFVTKKILRNRSKSQNRCASFNSIVNQSKNYGKWTPGDNLSWISDGGMRINLRDTNLQSLTDLEYRYLQKVALQKIAELNIGIDLNYDKIVNNKKMHGLLPKKRSMTTSFFDIGSRKDDVSIFGNSLESCVAKDLKNWSKLKSLASTPSERGSRNSIVSLFTRVTPQAGLDVSNTKLHESVRSCESLPTNSKNWSKGMSRSQCDIRDSVDTTDEFTMSDHKDDDKCNLQVPNFVSICIKYLEEFGLHTVGLFRVSTSKKRVKQLREEFDKNVQLNIEANTCPHDIATLLKEFLRDLPEPLINENLYKAFLQTQKIRNRRLQMEAISHLIKLLPITHRDTLYVLLKFLAKVSTNADDICSADGRVELNGNRMDSYNLATVFAPNILRPTTSSAANSNDYTTMQSSNKFSSRDAGAQQENMTDAINVVRTLIDHYEDIFSVPADLIHTIYAYMLDSSPAELSMLCSQKASQAISNSYIEKCESLPTSPTMPTASTNLTGQTAPSSPERKLLYSREAVMHMNDATKTLTSIQPPNPVKRTRSSKNTMILRRQSTPTELEGSNGESRVDKDGIVTGSLQISMAFKRQSAATEAATTKKDTNVDNSKQSIEKQELQQQKTDRTPPAPASITNIGGAILRSKTADFERINKFNQLKQQEQQSQSQSQQQQQQAAQPPLYKRQQLIRSAKTTTMKKS